jgi:hypothetical protein
MPSKLSHEQVRDTIEARGGKLLTPYVNSKTSISIQCAIGHIWRTRLQNIRRGAWCLACFRIAGSLAEAKVLAEKRGGEFCSYRFLGTTHRYEWRCGNKHSWTATYYDVKRGSWCPQCSSVFVGEVLCRRLMEAAFGCQFPKRRPVWLLSKKTNRRLELDGYNHQLGVAFEHQGKQHRIADSLYSGGDYRLSEIKARDDEKRQLCREHGVRLFLFYEVPQRTSIDELIVAIKEACRVVGMTPKVELTLELVNIGDVYSGADQFNALQRLARSRGCELITAKFLGPDIKMEWRCSRGHEWTRSSRKTVAFDRWCLNCNGVKARVMKKIHRAVADRGGKCLTNDYVNDRSPLSLICENGHNWVTALRNVRVGKWCPTCYDERRSVLTKGYWLNGTYKNR